MNPPGTPWLALSSYLPLRNKCVSSIIDPGGQYHCGLIVVLTAVPPPFASTNPDRCLGDVFRLLSSRCSSEFAALHPCLPSRGAR